jgi:predicted dehydrogenase
MQNSEARGLGANDPKAINFEGHKRNFEDVVEAIQAGRPPSVDGNEARRAVALICAIYESARNDGKKVHLA